MSDSMDVRRDILMRAFRAGIAAALPGPGFARLLPEAPRGRVIILAAGKAAASMTKAAEDHYLDGCGLERSRLGGLAVTRYGYGATTRAIPVIEAGHPVPDDEGLRATRMVLELAASAGADDLVLALLSGGGSANWTAPAPPLDLATKQTLTRALLRSGANIHEINIIRKHLSLIKGGRLARAATPATLLTIAISDVPHDDISSIASGPTVPDPSTLEDARNIIVRYGLERFATVAQLLSDEDMETPKSGDPCFERARHILMARPQDAIDAACASVRLDGFNPVVLGSDIEGEAREVARDHAQTALRHASAGDRVALISGGELTVTVKGTGEGGPNQEYALALAIALDGAPGISALAADTDGTDGGSGAPTDPAGAIVDERTLLDAQQQGIDPAVHLAANDSTTFFRRVDGLVTPGPTLTNVNDLRIILVDGGTS